MGLFVVILIVMLFANIWHSGIFTQLCLTEICVLTHRTDVINVSGHRLSTAEIESALIMNPSCSESAVVAVPDDLTGYPISLMNHVLKTHTWF